MIDFATKKGEFYYVAAQFKGEHQSYEALQKVVRAIDGTKANVTPYRLLIDGDFYVIVVGEVPAEKIRRRLASALKAGKEQWLHQDEYGKEVLRTLLNRREAVLANPAEHTGVPGPNGDIWVMPR
jgi:hypothetical protein